MSLDTTTTEQGNEVMVSRDRFPSEEQIFALIRDVNPKVEVYNLSFGPFLWDETGDILARGSGGTIYTRKQLKKLKNSNGKYDF